MAAFRFSLVNPKGAYIASMKNNGHVISPLNCPIVFIKRHSNDHSNLLSIWVLEDYDTQKWVLKLSVSYLRLFGCIYYSVGGLGSNVVAIHPDNNDLVFIVLSGEHKLISYGLNSKEVHTASTLQESLQFPPYVPCFLDFLSVAHHEEKLGVGQRDKREGRRQGR